MNAIKEISAVILIATILCVALIAAIVVGTGKSEIAECAKWSQEADAYPGFFLASWQKDQCDANGVIINAPVK